MMDKADQKLMKQIPVSSGAGRSSRVDGRNKCNSVITRSDPQA